MHGGLLVDNEMPHLPSHVITSTQIASHLNPSTSRIHQLRYCKHKAVLSNDIDDIHVLVDVVDVGGILHAASVHEATTVSRTSLNHQNL